MRRWGPILLAMARVLLLLVAGGAALFHLFSAGVSPFTALVQRPVHFAFMATLGFLGVGAMKGASEDGAFLDENLGEPFPASGPPKKWWEVLLTTALIVAVLASSLYLVSENEALVRRAGNPTWMDLLGGLLALLVVLELARRTTGWGLVVVAILALIYAVAGPHLPGFLAHRGYGFTRLMEHLYLSTEGIWGVPLGVSADFVYLFVLFGALLDMAGGGALLIGLADRATGRTRGGPAKTAALASALMGSLSGSAVANVVTTGTFTIPLMRRSGFKPFFAGAIEAAASTGGQLMPPVMGAGAFILATWTNIPYPKVAVAALVPALLYYVALLMAIHFRAGRMGLEGGQLQKREPVLYRLHLLLPLGFVVYFLAMG
ncbi:MAG: TRAP transporter fused permease subunit, partial [Longimicrobiales bacterium]|nr:TRAP transporter fused permease subunit [Longimicrobiales bacterium]